MNPYIRIGNNRAFKSKLIKTLARRGLFDEWLNVWQVFDDIASDKNESEYVRSDAACGMSILNACNSPGMMHGYVMDIWNTSDD